MLDEQTLGKLLEAAYVLQEHNRELQALELSFQLKREQLEAEARAAVPSIPPPKASSAEPVTSADYTLILAQIVETQHHIQVRKLGLDDAMALVAARVAEMGRASGAAVGIVDGKNIRYRGVAGAKALPNGAVVPKEKALCIPCLKTSQVFRCPDVNPEFLLDTDECRRRDIQSMIAVPVFHDGSVAGGLELYYSESNAFTEQDIHTCQLMAGLVTEALSRDEELNWKKSLATERAAMLDALEKLQPNLAALVGKPAAQQAAPTTPSPAPARTFACRKCGHTLLAEEQFCGQCGSPRNTDYEPPSMQSKVASLWQMQEAQKKESTTEAAKAEPVPETLPASSDPPAADTSLAQSIEKQIPELFTAETEMETGSSTAKEPVELLHHDEVADVEEDESAEAEPEKQLADAEPAGKLARRADWSSAASAKEFLEQISSGTRQGTLLSFWNSRRGDIYLAVAVILVACVIRWGIWSDRSVSATATPNAAATNPRKAAPDSNLSLFDRMLIQLGIADPPEAPEDKGNPTVQVWEDLHTALYYCPGADLYGKTPKGKFATQREAQLDQFEPAYRKPCN